MAGRDRGNGIVLPRRGFLLGLGAVLAAPAVVSASGLMQVRSVERLLYPIRGLVDYCVNTDKLVLRLDQANFELSVPRKVLKVLSQGEIRQVLARLSPALREALQPQALTLGRQQKCLDFDIGGGSLALPGFGGPL